LFERFGLLERHYSSDIARLRGIEEGGTLFRVLGQSPCPLCGASPAHQGGAAECEGNIDAIVVAARSEISKVEQLRSELGVTVGELQRESEVFDKRLPGVEAELVTVSNELDRLVAPKLKQARATYAELANRKGLSGNR